METINTELLFMKAWSALEEPIYDGWTLRSANGYSKRANCAVPLYDSYFSLDSKLEFCSNYYAKKEIKLIYKIIETKVGLDVDKFLQEKGLKKTKEISIQELDLKNVDFPAYEISISNHCEDYWFSFFVKECNLNTKERLTLKKILHKNEKNSFFISKMAENKTVGIGLGVIVENSLIIFDIHLNKNYRNLGFGSEILKTLLSEGRAYNLEKAYIQVFTTNPAALNFYNKLGFTEKYKSWYRY